MSTITREQARIYLERWALVHEAEAAELRRTPMETKLKQLAALMQSRAVFGTDPDREAGVEEVRERWVHIRRATGV